MSRVRVLYSPVNARPRLRCAVYAPGREWHGAGDASGL